MEKLEIDDNHGRKCTSELRKISCIVVFTPFRPHFSDSIFLLVLVSDEGEQVDGLSQPVVFILGISRDYLIRGWRTGVRECKANTVAEN